MVKYEFAKQRKDGLQVHISTVERNGGRQELYWCPCCKREMLPVLGDKRERHFRHKGSPCKYDDYLHTVAEDLFIQEYQDCIEKGDPFYLEYEAPIACNNACVLKEFHNCREHYVRMEFDITKVFTSAQKEHRIKMGPGSFRRPDILLESSSGTQLWIEIFVTHQNTEDKLHEAKKRNVKVVEIHITDEQCKGIEDIRSHRIGLSEGTTLFNFNPKPILSLPIEVELPCMNYFVYEVKNGCANMEYRGEYDRDHDDSAEYYLAGKLNHGKCWNDDRVSGKRLSSLSVAELEDLCYKRFSGRRSSDISGLIVHEYRAPNKEEEARKNRRQADRMKIRVKEKPFSEELFSKLQQKQEVVLMEAVDYIPHYHVPDPAEWVDLNLPSGNLWSSCDGHWPESHLVGYDLCVP